ncbi:MAG TPA: hypothetical protein VFB62_12665 [Polyangiaceae bacterium]|nr:hypothetical protein [Polyangiaceae bacterium]
MPDQPPGYEIWHVTCLGCNRKVLFKDVGNDLVGKHGQLVCEVCGHRGAALSRVWHRDAPPEGVRVWKKRG